MPTPLYDALRGYAGREPLRFHMPGHKGAFLPAPELAGLASIDVTELSGTGDLYEAGEPFDSAQRLWADLFGFDCCQFLTGGSTMGIHTGLALCCRPGDRVLMDRGCHRAAFNALALLDLEPVWLERPWLWKKLWRDVRISKRYVSPPPHMPERYRMSGPSPGSSTPTVENFS